MTRRANWLLNQLPMGMLDDDFFIRFVSIFQELGTTLLDGAENIPNAVDTTVAPPELVRWLGSWLGVTSIDASLPDELQRRLVHQAGRNLAWRGTRQSLQNFLEVLTGAPAEIEETGGIVRALAADGVEETPRPRRVRIRITSAGWLSEPDLVELVADEIPAHVAWELHLGDRQLWPLPAAAVGATAGTTTGEGAPA